MATFEATAAATLNRPMLGHPSRKGQALTTGQSFHFYSYRTGQSTNSTLESGREQPGRSLKKNIGEVAFGA